MLHFLKRRAPSRPALPPGHRVYAIGDVHGCLAELESLLALIEDDDRGRSAARTQVILVGDLIDRGPQSAKVVERLMRPLGWAPHHVLRGNHEDALVSVLNGDLPMLDIWLDNGGDAALASWGVVLDEHRQVDDNCLVEIIRRAIPMDQQQWLSQRKIAYHLGEFFFVHAGIRPRVRLLDQDDFDCLWIRDAFLSSRDRHEAVIVHGHSIADDVELRPRRIGLDTGAYRTGKLSAVGLEGDACWVLQTPVQADR